MRDIRITPMATAREQDSLGRYLADIARFPRIDIKEEVELARRVRLGDKSAEEKLINANLRFVVSCAKKNTSGWGSRFLI